MAIFSDDEIAADVTRQMKALTAPFVCPMSYEVVDTVRLRGTGNFIEILRKTVHRLRSGTPAARKNVFVKSTR